MTEPRPPLPASMLRPALALLAGLGVTVLIVLVGVTAATLASLRGVDPKDYVAPFWTYPTHLVISTLGAIAGGFTTSRIAADRSLYTTLALSLVLLMSGLMPILRSMPAAPGQPVWYPLSLAIGSWAGAVLGGMLERRPRRGAPASTGS